MAAINQNFEMYAGEDKQLNFTITDETGDAAELLGSSAIWVMANILSSSVIKITKSTEAGTITIKDNVFQVFISKIDTNNVAGKYKHELRMVNSEGKESVVAVGEVIINKSLTYVEEA